MEEPRWCGDVVASHCHGVVTVADVYLDGGAGVGSVFYDVDPRASFVDGRTDDLVLLQFVESRGEEGPRGTDGVFVKHVA